MRHGVFCCLATSPIRPLQQPLFIEWRWHHWRRFNLPVSCSRQAGHDLAAAATRWQRPLKAAKQVMGKLGGQLPSILYLSSERSCSHIELITYPGISWSQAQVESVNGNFHSGTAVITGVCANRRSWRSCSSSGTISTDGNDSEDDGYANDDADVWHKK